MLAKQALSRSVSRSGPAAARMCSVSCSAACGKRAGGSCAVRAAGQVGTWHAARGRETQGFRSLRDSKTIAAADRNSLNGSLRPYLATRRTRPIADAHARHLEGPWSSRLAAQGKNRHAARACTWDLAHARTTLAALLSATQSGNKERSSSGRMVRGRGESRSCPGANHDARRRAGRDGTVWC